MLFSPRARERALQRTKIHPSRCGALNAEHHLSVTLATKPMTGPAYHVLVIMAGLASPQ